MFSSSSRRYRSPRGARYSSLGLYGTVGRYYRYGPGFRHSIQSSRKYGRCDAARGCGRVPAALAMPAKTPIGPGVWAAPGFFDTYWGFSQHI